MKRSAGSDEEHVRNILERWAQATRTGARAEVLANHAPDVIIYDVLPPLMYQGADAYARSWDEWQPETQGEGKFDLHDLSVSCGNDVSFAYGFIACGGTLPDGTSFEDLVRATFCLRKISGAWKIVHQHISKPFDLD